MANFINQIANKALGEVGVQRQFQSGLCDCSQDTGSCCDTYFCTPCQVARQCNAIDGQANMNDGCLCFLSLVMLYYGNGGQGILAMILRYRLIDKYNYIGEGVIKTFFMATCCPLCSMCQTHRELKNVGFAPGGTCCGTVDGPAGNGPMN